MDIVDMFGVETDSGHLCPGTGICHVYLGHVDCGAYSVSWTPWRKLGDTETHRYDGVEAALAMFLVWPVIKVIDQKNDNRNVFAYGSCVPRVNRDIMRNYEHVPQMNITK